MKIIPNNIPYKYSGNNEAVKITASQSKSKKISQSFDQIILSTKSEVSDEKFVNDLTEKITKEVCSPSSSRDLEEIRSQIEDGTYHIGIDEIAKKMILC